MSVGDCDLAGSGANTVAMQTAAKRIPIFMRNPQLSWRTYLVNTDYFIVTFRDLAFHAAQCESGG